ncbi:hypothetical protein DFH06DRAFT_1396559 [Mycena polygramma]|nr:hypothetical protein DFH06DRAFT_1396559 [Mycena polygramma]
MSDLMNKAKAALSSSGSSGTTGNTGMQGNHKGESTVKFLTPVDSPLGNQAVGGQEDYADKGLDFIEKKQGMTQNRGMNEKITDTAREGYEKVTGNAVSSKISN